MKRVLHLGAGNLFGGIETLLVTVARERGQCPEMVPEYGLCFEGRFSQALREAGATVHVFGKVRFSRPWTVWLARRHVRQLLLDSPPDVAVTHACWPHAVFGPAVRGAGVPLVFWAHDSANMGHWLDRKASRIPPDRIIANSHFTASGVNALFPAVPVDVVHAPVAAPNGNPSRREQLRGELQAPAEAVVILMASRMEAWKGHQALLEALAALKGDSRWRCWIAGGAQRESEQEYLGQLRQRAADLNLSERIQWLGERRDVPDLMSAADIYCQPNLTPEPFGIVLVEALYSCRPVIAARQGGAMEIVDDTCGILVEAGNASALAEALARCIDRPELRNALGQAGPARAASLCGAAEQLRKLSLQFDLAARGN
jgi:glycosyltransferase involved in cell wall biosynthesis